MAPNWHHQLSYAIINYYLIKDYIVKKELLPEEINAIELWTNGEFEYRKIKAIQNGIYKDSFNINEYIEYEKKSTLLLGLFDQLNDTTNEQEIFRGDIIEYEGKSDKEIYTNYMLNNKVGDIISIGKSILSCTLIKQVAETAPESSDDYRGEFTPTILYIIDKRKSKFINISQYSTTSNESEVLCGTNKKFIITSIDKFPERNHLNYYLNEV